MKQAPKVMAAAGRARALYNDIPKQSRNGVQPVPATLRLESTALGTQSSIDFYVTANSGPTANPTEKRLSITDTFTCTEIGFFLIKVTTAAVTGQGVLRSYINPIEFSGSNEATALQTIYNGFLNVTIDGTNYLPQSWDMWRHWYVPTAQKAVLTAASGTNNAIIAEGYDNSQKGFYPITPTIVFRGNSKNNVSIQLPASAAMAGTSSSNYAVLMMRGFLQQSSTKLVG